MEKQTVLIKKTYERKVTLGSFLTQYDYITHGSSVELSVECTDAKEMAAKMEAIGKLIVNTTEKEIENNIEKLKKEKE
jgi:hypothetical protein